MSNDIQPISPQEAVQTYLRDRETELADASLKAHEYRLQHFVRWCGGNGRGVENMNDLSGRDLHEYKLWRREDGDLNRVTLKTQMDTLRVFVRFCERIDAVHDGLHEKVVSPSLSGGEDQRDVMLSGDEAKKVMDYVTQFEYASFEHVVLALLWHTGIRTGTARAIDVPDYQPGKARIRLRHRPEEGTPLKNGGEGERFVALTPAMCNVLDDWITHRRPDTTDDNDREPLLATTTGRPATATIREAVYRLTRPCEYTGDCPHSREIGDCEATDDRRKTASKCPSSVSPHAVRRGSITHHLTNDVPEQIVSDRMNVNPDVLSKHYDERSEDMKVEQRRGYLNNL